MNPSLVSILLIDRSGRFAPGLNRVLATEGYAVQAVGKESDALRLAKTGRLNVIIKSFEPGQEAAFLLMDKFREISPDTQFIFVSEGGSVRTAIDAIHHGAFDYLSWPSDNDQVLRSVRRALEHQAVVADDPGIRLSLRRRAEVNIFAGTSASMQQIQQVIERVASSDVTVLIEGESGTGKEIAARALHEKSPRKDGPFVAVNCAALPDSLIESELFGHVRGAFTGASTDKPGRFELARDGTLFLDEIGDLSLLGQADLLRVLEDGVFRPIGSRTVLRSNVRVVAASNKDLEKLCAEGKFRDDLFYRLNVITLTLPPLRERAEDIPMLAEKFAAHFGAKHRRRVKSFSPECVNLLISLPWPGNVRQLRNLVERLALTAPGPIVRHGDLPRQLVAAASGDPFTLRAGVSLARVESELIRRTLAHTGGNRTEAAKVLGISRRALHYKLDRYRIARPRTGTGTAG